MSDKETPGWAIEAAKKINGTLFPAQWPTTVVQQVADIIAAECTAPASQPAELKKLQIRTDKGEVWYWQGDGHDFPESIGCPVIMQAATLRALLAEASPQVTPSPELGTCDTTTDLCIGEHDGKKPHKQFNTCSNWEVTSGKSEAPTPERPKCDYTGAPSLDSDQLCRCGTCQLYAKILFNWLESRHSSVATQKETK